MEIGPIPGYLDTLSKLVADLDMSSVVRVESVSRPQRDSSGRRQLRSNSAAVRPDESYAPAPADPDNSPDHTISFFA